MASSNRAISDLSKLETLTGANYKRWSQKLLIFFEQLEVDYVLFEEPPEPVALAAVEGAEGAAAIPPPPPSSVAAAAKYEKDNKTVRGHILYNMSNSLFDLFVNLRSAKEIWIALQKKYGGDDAGMKKYVVGNWLKFHMVEDKPIMDQLHEYENQTAAVLNEGMKLCEVFQANELIERFPPSWNEYRNSLKHKKRDLTLQELISHMRTEEANRLKDKPSNSSINFSKANLVESGNVSGAGKSHPFKKEKTNGKRPIFNNDKKSSKDKITCYLCGAPGHKSYQCAKRHQGSNRQPFRHAPKTNQANLAEVDDVIAAVVEANLVENKKDWVIDTGASRHFCTNRNLFHEFHDAAEGECVYMGNSSVAGVLGKGKVILKLTSGKTLSLSNVMFVPSMRRNLVSGALLSKAGLKIVIESDRVVMTKGSDFVGKGYLSDGLFVLSVESEVMNEKASSSAYMVESLDIWHGRLGHVNYAAVKKLRSMELIPALSHQEVIKCEACVEAKFAKKSFKKVEHRTSVLLELIHTDLAEFRSTMSRGGKMYYISFVDDFSRYTRIYLLRTKNEASDMFLKYKAEVENQLNLRIKRLRSDRGGEYSTLSLKTFCEENGIVHEFTAPYTPEQNGIAERKNRTLKNMISAMLVSSGLPNNMWGEAALSACYILNRVPHKKLDKTPYELWKGFAPTLRYLKVWGCLAKVRLTDPKQVNIGSKTFDCVFIGYAQNSAAYRFLSVNDNSICESRDAEFFEHVFPMKSNVSVEYVPSSSGNVVAEPSGHVSQEIEVVTEPRRSKRQRIEKTYGTDFITAFVAEYPDLIDDYVVSAFMICNDPVTYKDAMSSVDASLWKEAIQSEIESITSNHTWELVDLPVNCKPIKSKWIFRKKLKPDGSIDRYKARLVVVGFSQKRDVDFFDTYSPVARISTIRTLVALASIHGLIVHQMDVKTAFLNGDLNEEIYIFQPEGCVVAGMEKKVCKLKKSLYGLKQAPIQWYDKFHNTILLNGFVVNGSESCLYAKTRGSDCVLLCLYVDDMLIFGTCLDIVLETKSYLSSAFDMKDLGEADVILGIKLMKHENGYLLSQSHYVEQVLKKFNCEELVPVKTPYDASVQLKKNLGEPVSQEQYARILGSVMYLMNSTRPDIAYAVNRLSRYTHNPSNEHWSALYRLMKYLKGTKDLCLHYSSFPEVVEGFCDANWVSDNDEVSSTSGFVFTLGGGAISWKSGKQACIAGSTMESEFIALELASHEAKWLRELLADVPMGEKSLAPISLHCDSQSAISVAKNSVYNGKRKHIRVKHGIVREMLGDGVISLDYIRSEKNLADPFTKALIKRLVEDLSARIGMKTFNGGS